MAAQNSDFDSIFVTVGVSAQGSLLITQGDYIIYGTVGRTLVIDCSVPVKLFNSSTQWFRDSQALELVS